VREERLAHHILRGLVHLAQDLVDPLILPVLDFCKEIGRVYEVQEI
jgi:hypothetical protein